MRRLLLITLSLLVVFTFTGCGDSGNSSSGPEIKEWYSGGNLHDAKMSAWSRASYANRLATSADFVTKMMQVDGKAIPLINDMRPVAEELERNISAANEDGVADSQDVAEIAAALWLLMKK